MMFMCYESTIRYLRPGKNTARTARTVTSMWAHSVTSHSRTFEETRKKSLLFDDVNIRTSHSQ